MEYLLQSQLSQYFISIHKILESHQNKIKKSRNEDVGHEFCQEATQSLRGIRPQRVSPTASTMCRLGFNLLRYAERKIFVHYAR